MRRRLLATLGAGTVLLAATGAWAVAERADGAAEAADGTEAAATTAATADVERRDLVTVEEVGGTLGYADSRSVPNVRTGTLTWAPAAGDRIAAGGVLYRVDGQPVFLFSGGVPAYRTLSEDSGNGRDIRQLEQNLVALGFDPDQEITVDNEFDSDTEEAVERWQDETGQEETGVVELGTIVFLPGARRVADVVTELGAPVAPGASVLTTTALRREATVEIDARDAGLVELGKKVQVELPSGSTIGGRVRSVGRVATATESEGQPGDPTIEVTIAVEGRNVDAFDEAPVTIRVESDAVRNALAVPVTALLAVAGGGYALEVVDGASTRLVRVEPGAFADGYVQVEGEGIELGTTVVRAGT